MPVSPETLYEQILVIRSQIGDEAAFRELLQCYGPRLLRFTERMMQSSPGQVGDVMQEIWIAIYRALPRLLDVSKFRPWVFRIARDRIYREYRRRKLPVQPLDETDLETCDDAGDDDMTAPHEELQQCLQAIGPKHREALVLHFL